MGSRASLDGYEKSRTIEIRSSDLQPVASRYNDYAMLLYVW